MGRSVLSVPPCPPIDEGPDESEGGGGHGHLGLPVLALEPVVATGGPAHGGHSSLPPLLQGSPSDVGGGAGTSLPRTFGCSPPGEDLDEEDLAFLAHHLSEGTRAGYSSVIKKFTDFCAKFGKDPLTCPPALIVKYIRSLFEEGAEYSTVNLHRSAISKYHQGFNGQPIGIHPLIRQAIKSVFRQNPPLPKYKLTFDAKIVFDYISGLPHNSQLSLKVLSHKTLILLIYSTLSRVSSLQRIGPDIVENRDSLILHLHSIEKQGRPGKLRGYIAVEKFNEDSHLCPVAAIVEYKSRVCNSLD